MRLKFYPAPVGGGDDRSNCCWQSRHQDRISVNPARRSLERRGRVGRRLVRATWRGWILVLAGRQNGGGASSESSRRSSAKRCFVTKSRQTRRSAPRPEPGERTAPSNQREISRRLKKNARSAGGAMSRVRSAPDCRAKPLRGRGGNYIIVDVPGGW